MRKGVDGDMHSDFMEDIAVLLAILQLIKKELVSITRMALCGHVCVGFHEETCVNADLLHCGVGSDLCMRDAVPP